MHKSLYFIVAGALLLLLIAAPAVPQGQASPSKDERRGLKAGQENDRGSSANSHSVVQPLSENKTIPVNAGFDDPSMISVEADMQAGRYDAALAILNKLVGKASVNGPARAKVERLAADCYYFKGLKEGNPLLLTAVELYKTFLQHSPDPAVGNDLVYDRIAKCYDKLKFYHESANSLDKLITFYPDSPFIPEAFFKLGFLYIQTGKNNRAAEKLIEYINKYPDGTHAKTATFTAADCYYRLQRAEFAGKWYDEGRKRWPDLQDVSRSTLQNMGNYYFAARRFDVALQLFSLFANLYPDEEFGITSFYMMARVSEAMEQKGVALKLYLLYKERYPQGVVADDCTFAMANLGVTAPDIKFPHHVMGNEDYLLPLKAYDKVLANSPQGEKLAAVMLAKGDALTKYARYQEGFDLYWDCLNLFPSGKITAACREKLQFNARLLIDGFYEKADYLATVNIYFQTYKKRIRLASDFDTGIKIADSMLMLGLYDEAADVYAALRRICKERDMEQKIALALAKIDIAKNKGSEAEGKLEALLQKGVVKDRSVRNAVMLVLADWYYQKGSYAMANPLFAAALNEGGVFTGVTYRNYALSLLASHLPDKAISVYRTAIAAAASKPYEGTIMADIYMGLGDACYEANRYADGIAAYQQAMPLLARGDINRWLNYRVGKGYMLLSDYGKAKKSFLQAKENADGEFWPKVTDYALESDRGSAEITKNE